MLRVKPGVRLFSQMRTLKGPNDDLARVAEQRERIQSKETARKADLRKMARKRSEARANPERSPYFMDIAQSLRYLRAAEVGRSPKEAVITITTSVVAQKGNPRLSGAISFPKPLKETRILVFSSLEEQQKVATAAGALLVGGSELVAQIKAGEVELNFDTAFATPEMVPQLNQLARTLGPRGLMPTVKKGTVSEDIGVLINDIAGSFLFRQKSDQISLAVGRANFTDAEIISNITAAREALKRAVGQQKVKKQSILGQTVIQSTHGPGLVVNVN